MKEELLDFLRTLIAFPFGLLSEGFARIALLIQPDLDVDFNYLKKNKVCKVTHFNTHEEIKKTTGENKNENL